jgi:hypothetical protein
MVSWAFVLTVLSLSAGCGGGRPDTLSASRVFTATGVSVLDKPGGEPGPQALNWDSIVEAEGHGFPAAGAANKTEERLTALEAARAEAMTDLVEKLSGVTVSRSAEVRDMRFASAETKVELSGALTGVKVVLSDYDDVEQVAHVVLRVGLDSEGKIVPERLLPVAPLSDAVRRAQAEEAARYDAVAKLREELGGAYITQQITVKNLMLSHQRASSAVEGLMASGVEYSKPLWIGGERCEVKATLTLTIEDLRRLRALAEPVR